MKESILYIATNRAQTFLYVDATNNIVARMKAHKRKVVPGFAKKYNCTELIYVEMVPNKEVSQRVAEIRGMHKADQFAMIEKTNPDLKDLARGSELAQWLHLNAGKNK